LTSKLLSTPPSSCSRLHRTYLAYEHQPGPELGKDDRGAKDIPIILGDPPNELDSSVGHKEDLGTYAELRGPVEDSISRTSLSHMGTLHRHSQYVTASLSLHMHGGYYMNVPQMVQIDFECVESGDDVRFILTPQGVANVRSQAPKISGIWNNRHVLTWATKYACARVHQTFLEGEDGQSNPPLENEETNNTLEDSEEQSPNQDLYTPIPPNRNASFIIAIIICSG
jgi:hypothetical protein